MARRKETKTRERVQLVVEIAENLDDFDEVVIEHKGGTEVFDLDDEEDEGD